MYCMAASTVAIIPSAFAHCPRELGRASNNHPLMKVTTRPWRVHTTATETAVRHVYWLRLPLCGRVGFRGKKTRNSSRLLRNVSGIQSVLFLFYMTAKQNHCTPTCAIPRSPAVHSNELISLQHATSARDAGKTIIFAKALVPEVVPRSMKYGEMPSEVPRAMIR